MTTPHPWQVQPAGDGWLVVSRARTLSTTVAECVGPEAEDNARLCAAAPEMLELLELVWRGRPGVYTRIRLTLERLGWSPL